MKRYRNRRKKCCGTTGHSAEVRAKTDLEVAITTLGNRPLSQGMVTGLVSQRYALNSDRPSGFNKIPSDNS